MIICHIISVRLHVVTICFNQINCAKNYIYIMNWLFRSTYWSTFHAVYFFSHFHLSYSFSLNLFHFLLFACYHWSACPLSALLSWVIFEFHLHLLWAQLPLLFFDFDFHLLQVQLSFQFWCSCLALLWGKRVDFHLLLQQPLFLQ